MADNREALRLELRQVIQADRMAADIIQKANDTRKSIEQRCEKEKADILAEAQQRKQDMARQVEAEQAARLEARKAAATQSFEGQKQALGQQVAQHSDAWVKEITARILGA